MYRVRKIDSEVELSISLGSGQKAKNKAAFKALEAQKSGIEADFGGPLDWRETPESDSSHIGFVIEGGYRSPSEQWPAIYASLTDAMVRLDSAMRSRVAKIGF
jgi:hypothetical protein